MSANYPIDGADEVLASFVSDYLKKRKFFKTASMLKEEIESVGGSVREQQYRLQDPAVDSPAGFLFDCESLPGMGSNEPQQSVEQKTHAAPNQLGSQGKRVPVNRQMTGKLPMKMEIDINNASSGMAVAQALARNRDPGQDFRAARGGTGQDGGSMGSNSMGAFTQNQLNFPHKRRTAGNKNGRDGKSSIVSEDESISENPADLDASKKLNDEIPLDGAVEGSTNSNSFAKKRNANPREPKPSAKRGRSNTPAAAAGAANAKSRPGGAQNSKDGRSTTHSNAIVAAVYAAAKAADEAGDPLPENARPFQLTQQGLYYFHDDQCKLWPGATTLQNPPDENSKEATETLFRRVLHSTQNSWKKQRQGAQGRDENMVQRSQERAADSISSKSAALDGRENLNIPGMSEKTGESGAGENNVGKGRSKEVGSKKSGGRIQNRNSISNSMENDGSGNASVSHAERQRPRGGKHNPVANQWASARGNAIVAGMDNMTREVQSEQRKQAPPMKPASPNNNGDGRYEPEETELFDSFNNQQLVSGRNGASEVMVDASFNPHLGFDPLQMRKGPDDANAFNDFLSGAADGGMQVMGFQDHQVYQNDEISTRRNQ